MPAAPEAWLRGPIPGIDPLLMPAAHALVQASEDVARAASGLALAELWAKPGGAASIGFHLKHICGSLDRLLTYARGRRSEEHTSELQSPDHLVCRLLLDKKRNA